VWVIGWNLGNSFAINPSGTVRGLPELDMASVSPYHSTHTAGRSSRAELDLGGEMSRHYYNHVRALLRSTDDFECERVRGNEQQEAKTIRQAQQGDSVAFERIYRLHSRRVYALCLRMVRNPTEAEDLTQEAFLRVFRKIQTFRGESAFSTWLHRLVLNVVLMQFRKKKFAGASLDEMTETDEKRAAPSREVGGPDLLLTGLIDRVNLQRAVEQLPPALKIVFVLHYIQGYKHHEIAEMMNCSVASSKGYLHRARKRLRALLRESLHELPLVLGTTGHSDPCTAVY
jgi:RNA polymerase sigma-70 factor (ECF subfamily)